MGNTLYENIKKLCTKKGISVSLALGELGISTGTATNWKKGGVPQNKTVKRIADYFGVTIDELLANNEDNEINKNEFVKNENTDVSVLAELITAYSAAPSNVQAAVCALLDI